MTGADRSGDALALAEAVAAGEMTLAAAETALRSAHDTDARRADAGVAELRDLVAAIQGVRRHAEAFHRAADTATIDAGPHTVEPTRVDRGDVRLRPNRPVYRSRVALPGILAAAAVVLVAVVIGAQLTTSRVAATPSPSSPLAIASSSPSAAVSSSSTPSTSATVAPPSAVPTSSPVGTGADGVPPIVSVPLAGAPGIVYWRLTSEDTIAVADWHPDGSAGSISFAATIWSDPSRTTGGTIDRRVVASPDGRRVALAESDLGDASLARLRVFDADGAVAWTDPDPISEPELAWSADGIRLAIGRQPGMWRVVTFSSSKPTVDTFDLGGSYALLGFSRSGGTLYGYDSNGEADYWGNPISFPSAGGKVKSIGKFSGLGDPVAISNGTTALTAVAPPYGAYIRPGVDPKTGRVLDRGDLSGQLEGWEIRDGTATTPLDPGPEIPSLAWGPDGSMVLVHLATADHGLEVVTEGTAAPYPALTPRFQLPAGTYWQEFDGARGSTALLGLGPDRAHDSPIQGADELVAIDLTSAQAAVLVPDDPGLTGLHVAGWIMAGRQ